MDSFAKVIGSDLKREREDEEKEKVGKREGEEGREAKREGEGEGKREGEEERGGRREKFLERTRSNKYNQLKDLPHRHSFNDLRRHRALMGEERERGEGREERGEERRGERKQGGREELRGEERGKGKEGKIGDSNEGEREKGDLEEKKEEGEGADEGYERGEREREKEPELVADDRTLWSFQLGKRKENDTEKESDRKIPNVVLSPRTASHRWTYREVRERGGMEEKETENVG